MHGDLFILWSVTSVRLVNIAYIELQRNYDRKRKNRELYYVKNTFLLNSYY